MKILELTYDSDSQVKLAAIDALVDSLDILSTGYKRSRIVPTLLDMMGSFNEEVMKKMAILIGKIIHKLEPIILEDKLLIERIQTTIKVRNWKV